MTLTYEQRKRLTEYLGECWLYYKDFDGEGICKKCGQCAESHRPKPHLRQRR
jgi:7-cyano-7-deazaguanine synthase in queuosine biosynthesis